MKKFVSSKILLYLYRVKAKEMTRQDIKELIESLTLHPEDEFDTNVQHEFQSVKHKIVAIALYDFWRGAIIQGLPDNAAKAEFIYSKFYKKELRTLFNIAPPKTNPYMFKTIIIQK